MTGVAATSGLARPGRGWVLACLYPVVALLVVLFVAYPIVDLLLRALQVDGRFSPQTIVRLLADAHIRQVVWNTLLLGLTVAVLGTILATLYAYAMTRIALPWKRVCSNNVMRPQRSLSPSCDCRSE